MLKEVPFVLEKLDWMEEQRIWPNGPRYLWTDAFGVVLLVSLYRELDDELYLRQAEWVVEDVERVLGLERGLRIGEAPDREGQYFHYLAMWAYALDQLGKVRPGYRERAVGLVRAVHPAFVRPGAGVYWKLTDDLNERYAGAGFGALDAFQGYVIYRLLAPEELDTEIAEMEALVDGSYRSLEINQDLSLGMMLWLTHFFPDEPWAVYQRERCLEAVDRLWTDPPGYFCRHPGIHEFKLAFSNYGVSLGLQAVDESIGRVRRLNAFFETYRSGDAYDREAITHVMACTSRFPGLFLRQEVLRMTNGG